jgi:hypothetical protein
MLKRRYEILLPAKYNDGRAIMTECMQCFSRTFAEVINQFGALSYSPNSLLGVWVYQGKRYDDELFQLTIDVEDKPENRQFIAHLKKTLLERFEQLEIYVASYPIEVI